MKKELTWLEVYEKGRGFRAEEIKESLGGMSVSDRLDIEHELNIT